ncbi:MAG TPA: DUF2934 domain-containing protein [Myxococcales bacterium]|nr:DUF2934 domain-containing protein [Myxococcales bacterium]
MITAKPKLSHNPTTPPPSRTAAATKRPTNEQIAARAYELFVARGRRHGHHEEDWFQAEQELRSGLN